MLRPLPTAPQSPPADDHQEIVQAGSRESPGHMGAMLQERGLRNETSTSLLVVDQLEELVHVRSPSEGQRRASPPVSRAPPTMPRLPSGSFCSMRSDFIDRVGEDRRFLDDLVRGLHFLQPLPREALREALEAPVAQLGYSFETPGLLTEMVDSLAATPGSLPLLQFAGSKLWEARDDRRKVLTVESYRQMGGISGVLAQHADRVVAALPPALRSSVRGVFQRLVTAAGTRAIVDVSELESLTADPSEARALVEHLAQARFGGRTKSDRRG